MTSECDLQQWTYGNVGTLGKVLYIRPWQFLNFTNCKFCSVYAVQTEPLEHWGAVNTHINFAAVTLLEGWIKVKLWVCIGEHHTMNIYYYSASHPCHSIPRDAAHIAYLLGGWEGSKGLGSVEKGKVCTWCLVKYRNVYKKAVYLLIIIFYVCVCDIEVCHGNVRQMPWFENHKSLGICGLIIWVLFFFLQ
jgi:hypothetical protein